MSAILPHDYSKFTLQRCQGLFRPTGKQMAYNLLSMSKVTISPTFEYIDVLAYDDAETVKVDSLLKTKSADISITMDEKTEVAWHAGNASNDITSYNSQEAGALIALSIPEADIWFDAVSPGYYQIRDALGQPVQNISMLVLKWGKDDEAADVTLTAGVNYNFNPLTGVFWLLKRPDDLTQ